jgi:hypothetical protein
LSAIPYRFYSREKAFTARVATGAKDSQYQEAHHGGTKARRKQKKKGDLSPGSGTGHIRQEGDSWIHAAVTEFTESTE